VERFTGRESALGRDDLILPIYYVQARGLTDADDPIASTLLSHQYADWRALRFEPFDSPPVRRELAKLAGHIVQAIERTDGATTSVRVVPTPDDNAPGFVELLAEAEVAMPLFNETIQEFGARLSDLNTIVSAHVSFASVIGPVDRWFCQRHWTTPVASCWTT